MLNVRNCNVYVDYSRDARSNGTGFVLNPDTKVLVKTLKTI